MRRSEFEANLLPFDPGRWPGALRREKELEERLPGVRYLGSLHELEDWMRDAEATS
jgi:hypothetical protein